MKLSRIDIEGVRPWLSPRVRTSESRRHQTPRVHVCYAIPPAVAGGISRHRSTRVRDATLLPSALPYYGDGTAACGTASSSAAASGGGGASPNTIAFGATSGP